MEFLSRQSLARLGLDDEVKLLETIANLTQYWPQLREGNPAESVLDYLATLEDQLEQQRPLLESLDINPDALTQLARKFRKAYAGELPESLQKLLHELGAFREGEDDRDPGLVRWKLYDEKDDRELVSADALTFSLKGPGQARIDLEAGDQPALAGIAGEHLLRVGFAGRLGGAAAANFAYGKAGLDADAEGRLDYWFAAPPQTLFASAAAEGLRNLPSPFSLASINDAAERGFRGLQLRLAASIKASVSVEYGIFEGGGLVDASAGIDISASYDTAREFDLGAWRDPQDNEKIALRIKRARGHEINSTVGLGLQLDMARAVEQLRETVIEPYLDKYEDIYEKFKPYLSPGTLLARECNEALSQAAARLSDDAQIQAALRLALGQEVESEQLQQEISARLVTWFNSGVGIYSRAVSADLPESAAAGLEAWLPAELPQSARDTIGVEVRGLIGSLQDKLKEAVRQRADAASGELVVQLGALNESVVKAMDGASTTLDKAFAGAREALAEIDERIHSIVGKLEEAASRKIKLRILSSEKILREREVSMELRLDRDSQPAAEFYRSLVSGRLDLLEELMQAQVPGVEVVAGTASELFGRSYTSGAEFSLFGISLGASSIVDSQVLIEKDAAGNIAVQSKLAVKRVLDGIREMQSAGFASQLSLQNLRRGRSLPIELAVTQEDERLKLDELDDFLGGLTDSGLLSPKAREGALALYRQWRDTGNRYINARVDVLLRIDGEFLQNLMDYAARENTSDGEMTADVLEALEQYGVFSGYAVTRACRSVNAYSRRYKKLKDPVALFAAFNVGMRDDDRPLKGRDAFFDVPFADTADNPPVSSVDSRGLREARAIHFQAKSWTLLMRGLHQIYNMDPGAVDGEQMERHNALMAFCLHKWLKAKQFFGPLPGDEVSAQTIAFMGLLARAAGLPEHYPLAIAMELVGDDAEPRLFS